jgi:hypothetical protein
VELKTKRYWYARGITLQKQLDETKSETESESETGSGSGSGTE